MKYAEENGYNNITFYADNGGSGLRMSHPAFMEMNADVEAGKIDTIFVLSIDRLGRTMEVQNWLNELRSKGIILKTVDCSLDEGSDPYYDFIHSTNTYMKHVS